MDDRENKAGGEHEYTNGHICDTEKVISTTEPRGRREDDEFFAAKSAHIII